MSPPRRSILPKNILCVLELTCDLRLAHLFIFIIRCVITCYAPRRYGRYTPWTTPASSAPHPGATPRTRWLWFCRLLLVHYLRAQSACLLPRWRILNSGHFLQHLETTLSMPYEG